ncbi:SWIM zinc finger family protein [Rhodohalobacter halophilus]|uniref:SWIM zinc finger family protein n=1 Tax=Rhodohalobacter halophilus TaxID=1812810 RepID=UPI00159F0AAF|nr:SWIM zinc finger family protein [Rhodohalobacter halophilus]
MSFLLNIDDPESNFPPVILKRGVDYLHQGRVENLSFEGDKTWTARVHGSFTYSVRIQLLNDEVARGSCSCPYADSAPCKHIAAVLLALEDEAIDWMEMDIVEEDKSPPKTPDDFEELLESATKKELIEAIQKTAIFNAQIEEHMRTIIGAGTGGMGKPDYRKIVKKALAPARRKGMMYGSEARRHLVAVYELLGQAEKLKKSGSIRDALDICQVVMEEMVPALQFIDDSNADVGESLNLATALLFKISGDVPDKERNAFFKWCLKSLDDKRYKGWDFEDDFLAMAVNIAQTDKQVENIRTFMDAKIERLEENPDNWSSQFHLERSVLQKVRLLRKIGDKNEADALLERYTYLTGVYAERIETAWQQEQFGRVKELAEAAIEKFEKKAPGLRKDWNEWLMKVSEKQGASGEVLERALVMLAEDPKMERFVKVKGLVAPDEWDAYLKEKVLPALSLGFPGRNLRSEVYALEGMWERLLADMKKNPHISYVQHYQHHFSETGEYPAVHAVFEIYEHIIWEALANRADRKNYRYVCRMLKKAIQFGAENQAGKLADNIREKYANRPSLLEELDKFGF